MSEEPASKRRRFEGAPSISDAVAPPFIVILLALILSQTLYSNTVFHSLESNIIGL
jgi:hypothetical protein